MNVCKFYAAGNSEALNYALNYIKECGHSVTADASEATHLILPVPSFDTNGSLKGGQSLIPILNMLPKDIVIFGGNLNRTELKQYQCVDFLNDAFYLAENANITAHCAIKLAMEKLPVTLAGCKVLVIGYGRIGKCLAHLLRQLGADVTICARKEADRASAISLGYRAIDIKDLDISPYRVVYNTAPAPIKTRCPSSALKIDLASSLGLSDPDVIWARGLPNKDAPESSGRLIAETAIRIAVRKENQL